MATDSITFRPREGPQTEPMLVVSIGIMAYNEEANIGQLLRCLLEQQTSSYLIKEIIVVASGCTDNTESIVREFIGQNQTIKLLVQPCREGKASAINLFLRHAQSDILVMESADTLPEPMTIQRLLEPFDDPEVGMTGGHPIPTNDPHTFMGFTAHLMWELHHQIALQHPKLGELVVFRRVFYRIPRRSAVDEVSIEAAIRCQGYQLRYIPEAISHNRGPETVRDFLRQRRRIYAGHLNVRHGQGYEVSTMSGLRILFALLRTWRWGWHHVFWIPAVMGLEVYGRFLGWIDYRFKKRDHAVWDTALTTKRIVE
ncbi:MAG TPA: glycosyltransferase [Sedimentisphaerales bacterium]|nr:glycosyltransferase [Sedimentisphaerales bacterium]